MIGRLASVTGAFLLIAACPAVAEPAWRYPTTHDAMRGTEVTSAIVDSAQNDLGHRATLVLRKSSKGLEIYFIAAGSIIRCDSDGRPPVLMKFDSGPILEMSCLDGGGETVFVGNVPHMLVEIAKAKTLIVELTMLHSTEQYTFAVAGLSDQWRSGAAPEGTVIFAGMEEALVRQKLVTHCADRRLKIEENQAGFVLCSGRYALGLGAVSYRFSLEQLGRDTIVTPGIAATLGDESARIGAMSQTFNTLIDLGGHR